MKSRMMTYEIKQKRKPVKEDEDDKPSFRQVETAKMYRDLWYGRK